VPSVALMLLVVEVPLHPVGRVQAYDVAPVTGAIENVLVLLGQTLSGPEIMPGVAGEDAAVTFSVCAKLFPQVLFAVTEMVPPPVPCVAVMLLVVDVPLQPFGKLQLYEVAPVTAVTEYVFVASGQTLAGPEMLAGMAGAVLTVTLTEAVAVQLLLLVTVMV
jgi:hypothetical protein